MAARCQELIAAAGAPPGADPPPSRWDAQGVTGLAVAACFALTWLPLLARPTSEQATVLVSGLARVLGSLVTAGEEAEEPAARITVLSALSAMLSSATLGTQLESTLRRWQCARAQRRRLCSSCIWQQSRRQSQAHGCQARRPLPWLDWQPC
jgi:hypothetical protein